MIMADNNENKVLNVPHLRFPEFSGEWEEHTLSEYLEFKNGLNPDAKRIGSGLPFISVMDILSEGVINYDNIRGKVNATEKEIECFGVKDGDLLFQRSSETLEDVGRANVYMDNRTAIYGGFVIRGRKIGNYDPLFFKYLLATPLARKRTCRMGAGAQHFNIGQEGLSKISLYFPSIEEQRKIAEFLSLIDERIATQNKIIEKLQSLIKGLVDELMTVLLKGKLYPFSSFQKENQKNPYYLYFLKFKTLFLNDL
jgi:type I restriction enzyme S subunit